MYLIVGLGNPEEDYANTRHNMGFNAINKIADKYNIKVTKKKFNALYGNGEIEGKKVILVKPQTYMNLSGESVIQFKKFYKIQNKDIIIIYDDMDLEIGSIRIKTKGSARNSQWYEISRGKFKNRRISKSKNWNRKTRK